MDLLRNVKRIFKPKRAEHAHHRCENCGAKFEEKQDTCPHCGSVRIATFERVVRS